MLGTPAPPSQGASRSTSPSTRTLPMPPASLGWRVRGEWVPGESAGGSPEHKSWIDNPQYHLIFPEGEDTTLRIMLRQDVVPTARPDQIEPICFFIVDAPDERRKRRVIDPKTGDPFRLIKVSSTRTKIELKARRAFAARPLPYILVPCFTKPGLAATFTLTVEADRPFVLEGPLPISKSARNAAEAFTPSTPVKTLPLGRSDDADAPVGAAAKPRARRGNARGGGAPDGAAAANPFALTPAGGGYGGGYGGGSGGGYGGGYDDGGAAPYGASVPATAQQPSFAHAQLGLAEGEPDPALRAALAAHGASGKHFPFEDPTFPPSAVSLHGAGSMALLAPAAGSGGRPGTPGAAAAPTWLRPRAFASARASLFGGAAAPRATVLPSLLVDDGWLLAAISAVGTAPGGALARVVREADYDPRAGACAVRLWTGGGWESVVVDDCLPCTGNRCAAGASADPTALWVSLIEKAVVKRFARSYAALSAAGGPGGALLALTGGVVEADALHGSGADAALHSGAAWARLLSRLAEGAILLASVAEGEGGGAPVDGLLPGAWYAVLDAHTVGGTQLVCVRDQLSLAEWRGRWAAADLGSWRAPAAELGGAAGRAGGGTVAEALSARTRYAVPTTAAAAERDAEGVFWIAFADFAKRFEAVLVCRALDGGGAAAGAVPRGVRGSGVAWPRLALRGSWDADTRGGSLARSSWRLNPQYRLSVRRPLRLILSLAPVAPGSGQPLGLGGALAPSGGGRGGGAGSVRGRIGWALLRAMPGTQRKVALAPADVLRTAEVELAAVCAGATAEIDISPPNGAFGFVVVPYWDVEEGAEGGGGAGGALEYVLSAYAALPPEPSAHPADAAAAAVPAASDWAIARIEAGDDWHALTCVGQWEGVTAGGCPNPANAATWLLNPHFSVAVRRPTRVQLLLDVAQPPGGAGRPPLAVGALVLSGRAGGGRKSQLATSDIVAATGYQRASSLSAECTLEPSAEPYWLLATAFDPGQLGSFALTLYSDEELSVTAVSGGGAVFRGARVLGGAGARALSAAPNRPLPPPSAAGAPVPPPATPHPAAATPGAGGGGAAAAAAGGGGGADGGGADTRALRQALEAKEMRIAELERRLRDAGAAGASADPSADEPPRPTMLEPPPTADESWPEVVNLGQGLSDRQRAALRESLREIEGACAASGGKWEDPRFPAADISLPDGLAARVGGVSWRRPDEIARAASGGAGGAGGAARLWISEWEIAGVVQGALNDRFLLSAANIVASNPELVRKVFVDTSLAESCGAYAFRFHAETSWEVVLVDDRLPCGPDGRLLFASCPDPSVFWLPLLEKAYAKFVGGYDRLDRGGTVMEALEDLTGSTGEKVLLNEPITRERIPGGARPDELWSQLLYWLHAGYVVGCQFNAKQAEGAGRGASAREVEQMGLEVNRAYALLTGGQMMGHKLLRVRAASDREWTGDWCDTSERWTVRMRQMLNYKEDTADGTFWISWDDFTHYFNKVYAMRMLDDVWTKVVCRGAWAGVGAGGATNFSTWRHNPQWLLRPHRQAMRVFATLTQLDARAPAGPDAGARDGYDKAVGLYVLRGNEPPDAARRKLVLLSEEEVVAKRDPQYKRTVSLECTLEPSDAPYVFMPCTYEPGREGRFVLTVQCDDLDDNGVPDFDLVPVGPPSDWWSTTLAHAWRAEGAGGSRAHDTWRNNPQFYLLPSARARVFAFLDVPSDGARDADTGEPTAPPPIQLSLVRGDGMARVQMVGPGNLCAESEFFQDDGLSLELSLGRASRAAPYVLVPATYLPGVECPFSLTVYSDQPFEFGSFDGSAKFPLCGTCQSLCPQLSTAAGGPLDLLLQRLGQMEGRFERLEATRYWEKIPQLRAGGTPLDGPFGRGGGKGARSRAPPPRKPPPAEREEEELPPIQPAPERRSAPSAVQAAAEHAAEASSEDGEAEGERDWTEAAEPPPPRRSEAEPEAAAAAAAGGGASGQKQSSVCAIM